MWTAIAISLSILSFRSTKSHSDSWPDLQTFNQDCSRRTSHPNSPRVTRLPENSVCSTALTSPDSRSVDCGESIKNHHFDQASPIGDRSATRIDPNGMLDDFDAECVKTAGALDLIQHFPR